MCKCLRPGQRIDTETELAGARYRWRRRLDPGGAGGDPQVRPSARTRLHCRRNVGRQDACSGHRLRGFRGNVGTRRAY